MKKQKISPELLQRIKEKVNIIEVVGEHVVLRKAGSNYVGLCPFHSERTPSFSVTENKQLFHCYGCKKGGDVVTFVMELHGLGFPEAIEELAERGKVSLPKDWEGEDGSDPETQKRRAEAREKTQLAYRLNRFVAQFYYQQLQSSAVASEYFRNRGVDDELIRNFYAGASQASWDSLAAFLVAKKAPLEIAVELGLIRPSPKTAPAGGVGYFDLFRNRAMFPILDLRGKVVGFGGRTLPDGDSGKDEGPKYMNSPESPLFHKSKIAFGLFQAQKYIREKDEIVIVEGYFDVLALHAAGFRNVVATCGTALTPEHLQLFRKFASRVTILFDGDRAGISATEQAMELGLTKGQILYGATLPEGLDPDEILFDQKTGKPVAGGLEKMTEILSQACPLLDVRMDEAVLDASKDVEGRTQAVKRVAAWLARFSDPVGREVRLLDFQKKVGIDRALLMAASPELAKLVLVQTPPRGAPPRPRTGATPGLPRTGGDAPATDGSQSQNQGLQPPPWVSQPRSQFQSPTRPQPRHPSSQSRPKARQSDTTDRLSEPDRIILWALAGDARGLAKVLGIGHKLPPEVTIPDLFDYPPARVFLTQFLEQIGDFAPGEGGLTRFVPPDLDIQVRSVLTEAATTAKSPYSSEDLQEALDRAIRKVWARFSQHIKARMHDAEAKKDAGLHEQLSKEYLDVQRKMKEFTSFYDEA